MSVRTQNRSERGIYGSLTTYRAEEGESKDAVLIFFKWASGTRRMQKTKGTYHVLVSIHTSLATNIKQFACQLANLEHRFHNSCHFYAAEDILLRPALGRRGLTLHRVEVVYDQSC